MSRRLSIFCFWEKDGIIGRSDENLLRQLREVSNYLVIVANGKIEKEHEVLSLADMIICRDNKGFDMGAYKEAFSNEKLRRELMTYDELILCNNTFFGPFIELKDIFAVMKEGEMDFWGLSCAHYPISRHIQSYLLVYKSSILKSGLLMDFFDKYVNENADELIEAGGVFEVFLFAYLVANGFRYEAYVNPIQYDIYRAPYHSMKVDGLPLLKKKVFRGQYCDRQYILNTLKYIYDTYEYELEIILQDIATLYGNYISIDEVKNHEYVEAEGKKIVLGIERDEMEKILKQHTRIYLYGVGGLAKRLYWEFIFGEETERFAGFIISDDKEQENEAYAGKKIYRWSQVEKDTDCIIIVAMNETNTKEIKSCLGARENVVFLCDLINHEKP